MVELVRSHSLARAPGFLHHHDVELAVLLTQDLDGARTFLRRKLGELASPPPASAELRDTVAAHIARNTVAYRVKKFEEIAGRSVGERRLELEAALRFAAFLGHDALGADAPGK